MVIAGRFVLYRGLDLCTVEIWGKSFRMEELLLKTISALTFIVISVLTLVIVLASVGKTLGIRKFYISVLIRIFEVDPAALIHVVAELRL